MSQRKNTELIVVEPIFYKAIQKANTKLESKYRYTAQEEDILKFSNFQLSKEEIEKFSQKIEKVEKNFLAPVRNFSREEIFDFLDQINLKYSPEELDKFGLSKSFQGSLIFSFLKYDFEQKYLTNVTSKYICINIYDKSEKEIEFHIERGLYYLGKVGQENFIFFISTLFVKLQTLIDIFLEEDNSSKVLDLVLKYVKIIKKILKKLRGENSEKITLLSHKSNNEIKRKNYGAQKVKELKLLLESHIDLLRKNNREIYQFLETFKLFEEELKKNKDDKNTLKRIFKVFKGKIYLKSPEGAEIGYEKN